jgi:hypothetical protein
MEIVTQIVRKRALSSYCAVSVILNGMVLQETRLPICWTGVDGPWKINTATATSRANKTTTARSGVISSVYWHIRSVYLPLPERL